MTPEFAIAVGPVVRWAKAQGWKYGLHGVTYDADWKRLPFNIYRSRHGGVDFYQIKTGLTRWLEPDSATQAVDVLCALGYLPARLSSQWAQGRDAALEAVMTRCAVEAQIPNVVEAQ